MNPDMNINLEDAIVHRPASNSTSTKAAAMQVAFASALFGLATTFLNTRVPGFGLQHLTYAAQVYGGAILSAAGIAVAAFAMYMHSFKPAAWFLAATGLFRCMVAIGMFSASLWNGAAGVALNLPLAILSLYVAVSNEGELR